MSSTSGRRQFARSFIGLGLGAAWAMGRGLTPAYADESALPVPDSLPEVAAAAARLGEPLVLLISLARCPYCELVRRNYLLPARQQGVAAWQINLGDRLRVLVGFDGQASHAAEQISRWKVRLAPTVLFLDPQGQELAERLRGIASVDFYGAYLDERLALARQALRSARQRS